MSEIYSCTCLLCSADLTALPFLRSLWNDIYERYIWHGKGINSKEASKFVLVFLFISKSSLQFVLHVVSNLMQNIVSHIFRKTLNLCVCLWFVLSLSLSHLLIIERPTFISILVIIKVKKYWTQSQTLSLTTSHRWDTYQHQEKLHFQRLPCL